MIDDGGTPLVCDFGLVRFEGSVKTGMTTTTAHTGTAVYLAHELVVGPSSPSTFSDTHALGCIGLSVRINLRIFPSLTWHYSSSYVAAPTKIAEKILVLFTSVLPMVSLQQGRQPSMKAH
jgi:serine/threonine protein kinase